MKLDNAISVSTIADMINADIIGGMGTEMITGINEIHKVQKGDITFVDVEKYFKVCLESAATFIIINKKVDCPEGKVLLFCDKPFEAYNKIALFFRPQTPLTDKIASNAEVHPSAIIEPGVIIADHVKIGANAHIHANVYIGEYSEIGENVSIQSGSIIGSDAFYFKKESDGYKKWRSIGKVIIEDDVEIGAGCTINKGVSGATIIGKGSKLDCQIHIGHGVVIGKRCLIAAQVGIGGKTIVGDDVVLYGQVGVAQNVTIGDKAVILAQSGVSKSLDGGKHYFGSPAAEVSEKYRELAYLRMAIKK
ncbi:MAG: UDP-3-O-(3-hydroxymyristoyl)glucosamine N-acyltransferase [Saprospiraceae bacterium]|nr:UDP-3-O-(3-hydroxymyristoyl)glucosamine N-acyltransferase [Saprospiraceae bacterium]